MVAREVPPGGRRRPEPPYWPLAISLFARQHDGIDVPAVIRLGAMDGAAVAEKAVRIGIGAQAEIFDMADAGAGEARGDIAREIEQGMAVARGRREKSA